VSADLHRFEDCRDEFIELVNTNNIIIEEKLSELQLLLSELLKLKKPIHRANFPDKMAPIKGFYTFLSDNKHVDSNHIIGNLQVKHFSSILKNVRKLIGFVSYEKLRLQVDSSRGTSSGLATTNTTQEPSEIYQTFITVDWLDYQEELPTDSDLVNPLSHFSRVKFPDDENGYLDEVIPETGLFESDLNINITLDDEESSHHEEYTAGSVIEPVSFHQEIDYSNAWNLIKDFQSILDELELEVADDLQHINFDDHVNIASNLAMENISKYWESLNLDKNKTKNVFHHRAWKIVNESKNSEQVKSFLDSLEATTVTDLQYLTDDDIIELSKLSTHVEGNRFLQCFDRFQPKCVDKSAVQPVLAQLNQIETVSERLGISSVEDFSFISESEVTFIACSLPVVSQRKLVTHTICYSMKQSRTIQRLMRFVLVLKVPWMMM